MSAIAILNVRLEPDKKERFHAKAKQLGLEASMIIRMFIDRFIEHKTPIKIDLEKDVFDNLFSDKDVQKKLISLGNELDKIGF